MWEKPEVELKICAFEYTFETRRLRTECGLGANVEKALFTLQRVALLVGYHPVHRGRQGP